jgi:hypothetical protein
MAINVSVKKETIKCEPQGGHLLAKPNQQIDWVGNGVEFTLEFAVPKTPPKWPQAKFSGTLNGNQPLYLKYAVKIDPHEDLDPIIIVDRN